MYESSGYIMQLITFNPYLEFSAIQFQLYGHDVCWKMYSIKLILRAVDAKSKSSLCSVSIS